DGWTQFACGEFPQSSNHLVDDNARSIDHGRGFIARFHGVDHLNPYTLVYSSYLPHQAIAVGPDPNAGATIFETAGSNLFLERVPYKGVAQPMRTVLGMEWATEGTHAAMATTFRFGIPNSHVLFFDHGPGQVTAYRLDVSSVPSRKIDDIASLSGGGGAIQAAAVAADAHSVYFGVTTWSPYLSSVGPY